MAERVKPPRVSVTEKTHPVSTPGFHGKTPCVRITVEWDDGDLDNARDALDLAYDRAKARMRPPVVIP